MNFQFVLSLVNLRTLLTFVSFVQTLGFVTCGTVIRNTFPTFVPDFLVFISVSLQIGEVCPVVQMEGTTRPAPRWCKTPVVLSSFLCWLMMSNINSVQVSGGLNSHLKISIQIIYSYMWYIRFKIIGLFLKSKCIEVTILIFQKDECIGKKIQ